MNLTVTCPHGAAFTLEGDGDREQPLRVVARDLLLACPRCRREAEGMVVDPGR